MLISASDPVAATLATALDGLSLQSKVIADNIANMDTPGFLASRVDFESSLRAAIADGTVTTAVASPVVTTSTDTPGANGNNVDLAAETLASVQAGFRYQLLSRAVGDRASLVTKAIGGM